MCRFRETPVLRFAGCIGTGRFGGRSVEVGDMAATTVCDLWVYSRDKVNVQVVAHSLWMWKVVQARYRD